MAISFIGAAQIATTPSSTSHVLTLPSYTADDVIVVSASWNGSPSSVVDDLGFADVFADYWGDNSNPKVSLMVKKMTGSEGTTITLTTGSSVNAGVSAQCFRGVDTSTMFDVAATNYPAGTSGESTFQCGSLTTVTDGCMLVAGAGNNSSSRTFDPPASPGTWTEDTDTNHIAAGKANTSAHALQATLGATGTVEFTREGGGSTFSYSGWLLALRPAVAATAGPVRLTGLRRFVHLIVR